MAEDQSIQKALLPESEKPSGVVPLHLVSDSTGDTVGLFASAALSQFPGIRLQEYYWRMVRSHAQMDRILETVTRAPGPVLYTLVDRELRHRLKAHCETLQIPCIAILGRVVKELSEYLHLQSAPETARRHLMDDRYFQRMEAIHYTLDHDDGQNIGNIETADIVLFGPSRTSKTPTAVYLSYRGYRAANVPYVRKITPMHVLTSLKHPLVVGLTIQWDRLVEIRRQRLLSLPETQGSNYTDPEEVRCEIEEAKQWCARMRWPCVDVTRRSVEETAATILEYWSHRQGERA
jgi:regulator of PEP synthase PpsR (kinase-PPPase family)